MNRYENIITHTAALFCGACGMALQITGARMLSPYIGSSMSVWTALIGVMLTAMTLGYHYGGKLADKRPDYRVFSLIVLLSGIFINMMGAFKDGLLSAITGMTASIELGAIIASVTLFVVPTFLLSAVSPYAVKMQVRSMKTAGKKAGMIYAIGNTGSVIGTFSAGFVLIPNLGIKAILTAIGMSLIALSVLILPASNGKKNELKKGPDCFKPEEDNPYPLCIDKDCPEAKTCNLSAYMDGPY